MSPMRILFSFLLSFPFLLAACGGASDSGKVFVPESGHPENWVSYLTIGTKNFHGTAIKTVPSHNSGAILFVLHCAPCHGNDASGKIGVNIQGVPASEITTFISIVPVMRGHTILSQDEIREIADYIATLTSGASPVIGVFDPVLCTQCHSASLDGGIARRSCFSCHNGPDGSIGHPAGWLSSSDDPLHFHGRYGTDFVAGCTTCHGADLKGLIGPSCFSCHDGTKAPILTTLP